MAYAAANSLQDRFSQTVSVLMLNVSSWIVTASSYTDLEMGLKILLGCMNGVIMVVSYRWIRAKTQNNKSQEVINQLDIQERKMRIKTLENLP